MYYLCKGDNRGFFTLEAYDLTEAAKLVKYYEGYVVRKLTFEETNLIQVLKG